MRFAVRAAMFRLLRDTGQDLRHAARTLTRQPAVSALVIVTLAVGIGANTALFSLVNAVLLRPLPVAAPGMLALFSDPTQPCARRLGDPVGPPGRRLVYSYPLYQRLRAEVGELEGLAAQEGCSTASVVLAAGPSDSRARADGRADGRAVSANYFSVLGVPAALGRTFLPEDETAPGANPVVVLSHAYWQRRFGGDPNLVGGRLIINGSAYTVIGVAAPGFAGAEIGSRTDFFVPLTMQEPLTRLGLDLRNGHYSSLLLLGRLRPGVALGSAEASVDRAYHAWLAEDPKLAGFEARNPTRVRLDPGATGIAPVRGAFRDALLVLMAGVGVLLVIVCLNVAHLLLARATRRQRELGIRTALGASRARLVRQLASEGLLLAAAGTALALLVARWIGDGLLALVESGRWETPLALEVAADVRVFAFTAVVSLATALLVGLVPALLASRTDVQAALRAAAPAIAGGSPRRLGRGLLISQVAFSLVLLVGSGLLARSLAKLRAVPTGLDIEHLLLGNLNLQRAGFSPAELARVQAALETRLTSLPGVHGVSFSVSEILDGGAGLSWTVVAPRAKQRMQILLDVVTPGYFRTMGMALRAGRGFTAADRAGAPAVAVINETLARVFFGGATAAIGQRFHSDLNPGHEVEVVGVVADAKLRDVKRRTRPMVFLPVAQPHGLPVELVANNVQIRSEGDLALVATQLRAAVAELAPGLPILELRTLRLQLESLLMRERLLATLATGFGLVALFLVCLGLYGVVSQWAEQRAREIGVRMALGATAAGVRWMVLRQGLVLVLLGVAVGIPAAVASGRLLESVLFGVRAVETAALVLAGLVLLAVATAASYLPARRASRLDPMIALRAE